MNRSASMKVRVLVALAALLGCAACTKAGGTPLVAPAVAGGESSADSLIGQARSFARVGDYLRAEQYLNAALAQGAEEERVFPLLLRACIDDQRYREAVQHVEDHLRRHPARQGVRFLLATLLLSIGRPEQARKELESVVAADPAQADAHYTLALVLRDVAGDFGAADAHFREYLRLRPQGSHADAARGALLSSLP
jgi:tetratricopeptide (TPR) repeat protein